MAFYSNFYLSFTQSQNFHPAPINFDTQLSNLKRQLSPVSTVSLLDITMYLPPYVLVTRGLVACGIFTTIAVVQQGYFWTALRNQKIDCHKGTTHNTEACLVDWIEVVVSTIITTASASAAVYSAAFVPRDESAPDPFDMVHIDGEAIHKLDVFHRGWMKDNLVENERKYILFNTSRSSPGNGKVMTEAWREDGHVKLTSYAHHSPEKLTKRSGTEYVHTSYEESDIKFEFPKIKTTYAHMKDAAQHIFDDFANRHAAANCIGFLFHPTSSSAKEAAWLGMSGSYSKVNTAPTCQNPETTGGYSQIGDLYITGY